MIRFKLGLLAIAVSFSTPSFANPLGGEVIVEEPPMSSTGLDAMIVGMDPSLDRLTMAFGSIEHGSFGLTIDQTTQAVYLNANGNSFSIGFSQFASNIFSDDIGARNHFLSELSNAATDDTILGFQSYSALMGDEPVPMACALSPCPMRWIESTDGMQQLIELHRLYGQALAPPDFSHIDPNILAYDRQRYENEKAAACNRVALDSLALAGSGAAAVPTCAAADSEAGAWGCFGSVVGIVVSYRALNEDLKLCNSEYNGPGTWEN